MDPFLVEEFDSGDSDVEPCVGVGSFPRRTVGIFLVGVESGEEEFISAEPVTHVLLQFGDVGELLGASGEHGLCRSLGALRGLVRLGAVLDFVGLQEVDVVLFHGDPFVSLGDG